MLKRITRWGYLNVVVEKKGVVEFVGATDDEASR